MKILLFSQLPPNDLYSGCIALNEICSMFGANNFVNAVLLNPALRDAVEHQTFNIPTLYLHKPAEAGIKPTKYAKAPVHVFSWVRNIYRQRSLSESFKKVVEFGKLHQVEAVCALLDVPAIIHLAPNLAKTLNVPLYSIVFDVPTWYMNAVNMDPYSIRYTMRRFVEALKLSTCCAVASKPMSDDFTASYDISTVVIPHVVENNESISPLAKMRDSDFFRIGLAGQLYATDAWNCLIRMLEKSKWTICGRKIVVRLLGRKFSLSSSQASHFEYMGWHQQQEAVQLLSECDLLYCPYPFDITLKEVSRLSFPSKVSAYLAAMRPILLHGPDYAAPIKFFRENGGALLCTTLNEDSLLTEIEKLFLQQDLYGKLCVEAQNLLTTTFCRKSVQESVHNFLGHNKL